MLNLGVAGDKVEERWLDQRQRAHVLRPARRRDQRSQYAVRVSDDGWSGIEQGPEMDCVDFEVVPSGRTGRVATPMNERQRPARAQGGERSPRRFRARATVDEQDLMPYSLADNRYVAHDVGRMGE